MTLFDCFTSRGGDGRVSSTRGKMRRMRERMDRSSGAKEDPEIHYRRYQGEVPAWKKRLQKLEALKRESESFDGGLLQ